MNEYTKVRLPEGFDPFVPVLVEQQDEDGGVIAIGEASIWNPEYRNVLDRGFVGLVDFMGSDQAIVDAARTSYQKGTKHTRGNRGLIRYLMRHWHTTPFEMCEVKFHVKAPIFVFRQWHRHRTASINEESARYSVLSAEFYTPEPAQVTPQSTSNKQGREFEVLSENDYKAVVDALNTIYEQSYSAYEYLNGPTEEKGQPAPPDAIQNRKLIVEQAALAALEMARSQEDYRLVTEDELEGYLLEAFEQNEVYTVSKDYRGIARELSRMVLPVATYSSMYWKCNLHNLMHFLQLRADAHAQYEIRAYADAILDMVTPLFPYAMEAFTDYRMDAVTMSRMEMNLLRAVASKKVKLHKPEKVRAFLTNEGCSEREINEFLGRL